MIIRKWEFKDNLAISKIEKECFSNPWTMQMISDTFMRDDFLGYVCEVDGEVVGYIATIVLLDEAEINLVAVNLEYRRKGIATKLLLETEKELKKLGVKKVFLEVRRSNIKAQALYEKGNFKYVGVRPNYYNGVEDALLMSKILKG